MTRLSFVFVSCLLSAACSRGQTAGEPDQASSNKVAADMPMSAKAASAEKPLAIDIAEFTEAPLQFTVKMQLDAPPSEVWKLVSDHKALPSYFPPVKEVTVDNSNATTPNGVGCVRSCNFMGGDLTENIRLWRPPHAYGYSVVKGGAPGLTGHFGLVKLQANGGGTLVVWQTYFNHPEADKISEQLSGLLGMAGDGLVAKFGGKRLDDVQ